MSKTEDLRALADDIEDEIDDLKTNLEIWIEDGESKDKEIERLNVTITELIEDIEALKSELVDIADERDNLQIELDSLYESGSG